MHDDGNNPINDIWNGNDDDDVNGRKTPSPASKNSVDCDCDCDRQPNHNKRTVGWDTFLLFLLYLTNPTKKDRRATLK